MEKVLLDTDIGSDIDDAVCLAYLLSQPECDLVGITTVSGESDLRGRIASVLCKAAGKDVPIYIGAPKPILRENMQPYCPQASALGNWPHETCFSDKHAVQFMRETIRANPGEITLLAIGPFTNLGLLFTMDPELPSMLKQLVVMGGVFTNRLAGVGPLEWNAMNDPHATAVLYGAKPPIHRSVGLDVTKRVKLSADDTRRRFNEVPLLKPVLDFADVWFQHTNEITFHDPLAAVSVFEPLLTYSRGTVSVELNSTRFAGYTAFTEGEGIHEVAMDVSPDAFFEAYFKVFKTNNDDLLDNTKYIIDRFDQGNAMLEAPDLSIVAIPSDLLPENACEGDILLYSKGKLEHLEAETKARKESIGELFDRLKKGSNSSK